MFRRLQTLEVKIEGCFFGRRVAVVVVVAGVVVVVVVVVDVDC